MTSSAAARPHEFLHQLSFSLSYLKSASPIRRQYPFHTAEDLISLSSSVKVRSFEYDAHLRPTALTNLMKGDTDDPKKRIDISKAPRYMWKTLSASPVNRQSDVLLPPQSLLIGPPPSPTPFSDDIDKDRTFIRVVAISDTHSSHYLFLDHSDDTPPPPLPYGDILIHAGDFSFTGALKEVMRFRSFLNDVKHPIKVIIGGNHDLSLHRESFHWTCRAFNVDPKIDPHAMVQTLCQGVPGLVYLEDDMVDVFNYRIYGSPWSPEFYNWAWNAPRGSMIRQYWKKIPSSSDIVITHGPPMGYGDLCTSGERAGCYDLLNELQQRVKPIFHISGHIHEGYGIRKDGNGTVYINASTMNEGYDRTKMNAPIVFDLPIRSGREEEGGGKESSGENEEKKNNSVWEVEKQKMRAKFGGLK